MNTSSIRVYGASDDLIEVVGAVRDEFYVYDEPAFVIVQAQQDNQTVQVRLRVEYGPDGSDLWTVTEETDTGLVSIIPARGEEAGDDEDGCPGYSSKAVVAGGFAAELADR